MDKSELPFCLRLSFPGASRRVRFRPSTLRRRTLIESTISTFKFNAYLTVTREMAMDAAREAEREIASGHHRGPMHGVPVAVKDQFLSAGVRSTGGSRILVDYVPDEDATVIANLKQAGAVLLGKTNLTEFAITGFSHRYSTPRNPWDLNTYAGGSSSGSGAATGAYLCATSLGEDTGGSIRFPATWCGLVGLRPTWGLVSRYGVMRGVWSMDTVGPISRTVEDAAITLGAIAGHDPRDGHMSTAPVPDYRAALGQGIEGLRIGVVTEQMESELVDADVRSAVQRAITGLAELGATVEEVSLPLSAVAGPISGTLLAVEPANNHAKWVHENIDDYGHDDRILLLTGSVIPARYYNKAQKIRELIRRQVIDALGSYDALVFPTAGRGAQSVEDDPPVTSKETSSRLPFLFTRLFNLASCPAMSVPCGFDDRGMPVGLQIGGKPFSEETLFRIGHAYEQATDWHTRRPSAVA
ncbi:Glutamyl-tRNA(Gln) amidotransferase subunit A [Geodia barretti]|uniref:Glutamyl-tRNA(Gln) amidotransferase subunit A n=2 Tax=Geodia barretti TaxID=519541 RepID=A0AA35X6V8_GEOBA|nr:Glutamyl-tRNA(Gln) amidotransferase subunit A [Geodia barretti]